jgi:hypothetical protein
VDRGAENEVASLLSSLLAALASLLGMLLSLVPIR